MLFGGDDDTYHILWLFGEKSDGAGAIVLDLVLDQAHRGSRSPLMRDVIKGLSLGRRSQDGMSLGYLCFLL